MINYTASPLDSNKTLLQAFHDIETYLKNNPIYKVYTANVNYTPGKSIYNVSDINVGDNTIAEHDVIFFMNAYVGVVSMAGQSEIAVTNVEDLRGPAGVIGPRGPAGATGPQGPAGATGPQGPAGAAGPQGPAGTDGQGFNFVGVWVDNSTYNKNDVVTRQLANGMNSTFICISAVTDSEIPPEQDSTHWRIYVSGVQGEQGPQGPQGPAGATGAQGIQGPQGPQGEQGEQGPQGPAGATGAQGATGPQGPQGPQGPRGADGTDGSSFSIIGTVNTISELPSTATAGTAYFVGTTPPRLVYVYDIETNTWINQGYLQGPQGEQGPQGPQGPAGANGEQGPQGPEGPQGPQGIQGVQGATGPQGPQGPQGERGPQGEPGPQGEAGPAGTDGETIGKYCHSILIKKQPENTTIYCNIYNNDPSEFTIDSLATFIREKRSKYYSATGASRSLVNSEFVIDIIVALVTPFSQLSAKAMHIENGVMVESNISIRPDTYSIQDSVSNTI